MLGTEERNDMGMICDNASVLKMEIFPAKDRFLHLQTDRVLSIVSMTSWKFFP